MQHVLIFTVSLLAPFIIIRGAIHLILSRKHDITAAAPSMGVRFHHLHFGVMAVFAASLVLLFTGKNIFSVGLLGIGLGLILDEFIPSLLVPHQEPEASKIYLSSLRGTLILFVSVVAVVVALSLIL